MSTHSPRLRRIELRGYYQQQGNRTTMNFYSSSSFFPLLRDARRFFIRRFAQKEMRMKWNGNVENVNNGYSGESTRC